MLPTSARVAQEVYEPLIGIQYPMLCSRLGHTWQIGTTSIREDQLDRLWAAFRPVAPCLAKRGCKKGSQEQPYGKGLPAPRG